MGRDLRRPHEENMNEYKLRYAVDTDARTLADATRGSDLFLGLSGDGRAQAGNGRVGWHQTH